MTWTCDKAWRHGSSGLRAAAWRVRTLLCVALALGVALAPTHAAEAAAREDKVFTVGNFPIEARASDAVTAKSQAIAEGQQAALRSLLRRIVPVTAYNRIGRMKPFNAAEFVDGMSVRSERNSSTEYIAAYDFLFQAEAVRRLLDSEGIPFLDRQAPSVTLVPVYRAPAGAGTPEVFTDARGSDAWLYAWKSLDLANALTPVLLQALTREVHPDTVKALASGDAAAVRTIGREYQTETLLVALMEPDLGAKRVKITVAGRDAVAPFALERSYRLDGPDLTYTAELAAVRALGVLEGRWKAINVRGSSALSGAGLSTGVAPSAGEAGPAAMTRSGPNAGDGMLRIAAEFRSMGEWTQISRQLSATPEVSDLEVEGLSGRSARLVLRYPGGPQELAVALAQHGLILRNGGNGWVLTQR